MSDDGFGALRTAVQPLRGVDVRWFVAGGWALDLFLGRVTREHRDVDIALLRRDFPALRSALGNWSFERAFTRQPGRLAPLGENETLQLPEHEVYATHPDGRRLELLLNEASGDVWQFRRDLSITLPLRFAGLRFEVDLPYLAPEIVLLYKAKNPRPQDTADFQTVWPHFGERRRTWLREAITAAHPDCPWSL